MAALDLTRPHALYTSPATGLGTFLPVVSGGASKDASPALFPARAVRIYVFSDGLQPAVGVTDQRHVLSPALPPLAFASIADFELGYLGALYPAAATSPGPHTFAALIASGGAYPLFWVAS